MRKRNIRRNGKYNEISRERALETEHVSERALATKIQDKGN